MIFGQAERFDLGGSVEKDDQLVVDEKLGAPARVEVDGGDLQFDGGAGGHTALFQPTLVCSV